MRGAAQTREVLGEQSYLERDVKLLIANGITLGGRHSSRGSRIAGVAIVERFR